LVNLIFVSYRKTVFLFLFVIEKGMTDKVPVKGNCVDSGPSLNSGRNFIVIAS